MNRPGFGRLLAVGTAVLAIAGVLAVARAQPVASAVPSDLTVTPVISGLDHPWDVVFAPDGTMLFTQRPGAISARVGGETRTLADPDDVDPEHERGMMGLVLDPLYATNRYLYTCFASDINGPTDVRVVRWVVNAGYTALSQRTDIITGIPVGAGADRHVGCRLAFGPDGYLWVTTGDGTIGTAPQDKQSLAGKVLRVDRNGNGAPDNPGGAFLPQIYTYGHRNPQGISFRPSDGKAYEVEHGTDCDDEINLLVPGGNYGWDPTQPGQTSYTESRPMTDTARHPDAIEAVWSSGCPTIAPSGATFLSGAQWGDWDDTLAVAVLKDKELRIFGFDASGALVPSEQWTRFENQYGRLRTAVQGPDGDLYIPQDENPGAILRVHPQVAPSGFVPVTPKRILDTRSSPVPAGWTSGARLTNAKKLELTVAGANGVPANATAVVLNVTSTEASTSLAYVTAWPTGRPRPPTSSLNLQPGANVANSITVTPGAGGKVSFFTNTGATHLVADLLGYYVPSSGDRFTGTNPTRVLDTRLGPVPAGRTVGQKVTGPGTVHLPLPIGVVPSDATAVAVNITSTQATTPLAFVTAWPTGVSRPTASNMNLQIPYNVSNLAIVKVGTGDSIDLYTNTGATHLIVDVVGYFRPSTGQRFFAHGPARVHDTRSGAPMTSGSTRNAQVAGGFGVPGDATAVVLNATSTQASSAGGFLTVWAKGDVLTQPIGSNLNYRPPFNAPNQVIAKVGADDSISMRNGAGTVHIVLDIAGYFVAA